MKYVVMIAAVLALAGCAVQPNVSTMANAELCNTKGQALGFGNGPLLSDAKAEIARRGIDSTQCEKEAAEGLEFAKNYQQQQQVVNGINANSNLTLMRAGL